MSPESFSAWCLESPHNDLPAVFNRADVTPDVILLGSPLILFCINNIDWGCASSLPHSIFLPGLGKVLLLHSRLRSFLMRITCWKEVTFQVRT